MKVLVDLKIGSSNSKSTTSDLYGATTYTNVSKSGNEISSKFSGNDTQKSLTLSVKDSISGWGVIQDLAFFVSMDEV